MTDKETLLSYRLQQAEETLSDAEKMLESGLSPRSIINRAYYSMFYILLALFLHNNINPKTSKHSGVIAIFDREFVKTGKIEKSYSKNLHQMFDLRQQSDYKELIKLTVDDAQEGVKLAKEFLLTLKSLMGK